MTTEDLPAEARDILNRLNAAGYEAFVVGGCVRDCLLGKQPADWDIATSARPEEVKQIFHHTVDTGLKHGTVTVMQRRNGQLNGYEVTTYRIDGEYEDARHPKEVSFTGVLAEDLKRRDFTINAMAYHPQAGLQDLFHGREDLQQRVIRCVGEPKERFTEDALRMMRAIRFAAQLDAQIHEDTLEAIRALAPNIRKVSAERIRVEMEKLLVSDHPYRFKLFYESGLTKYFLPEWDAAMETAQENPHHKYTVGEHILHSLETVDLKRLKQEELPGGYERNRRILRLTMLFHDIAKPLTKTMDADGVCHFYGHPEAGAQITERVLRRLKYDNDTVNMVTALVRTHEGRFPAAKKSLRWALYHNGEELFPLYFYVQEADALAQSDFRRAEKLERIAELRRLYAEIRAQQQCVSLKTLAVKGADLIRAGVQPGPQLGKILENMLEDVLDTPEHNDKAYLMEHYVGSGQ
ncbi:MAG: CCA tRNA nucleotidyltransferase [Lachnospiraceae bacterium]|nr:CCA tRNA nucleotidyltransferase [Lachnospiraceae bacterium]